jgi:protein-disulfide isomerase
MMRAPGSGRCEQRFSTMIQMLRRGLVVAAAVTFLLTAPALRAAHDAATASQEILEETIYQYLITHPDVMLEVFDILNTRQQAAEANKVSTTLTSQREELLYDPAAPVGGNPDGDVTIVEFFDYYCSYCKRVMSDVLAAVAEDSGLRMVYKEFPILGPDSVIASRAALAVFRIAPDKYFDFHIAMMSYRGRLNEMGILALADDLAIDTVALMKELSNPEIDATIERNRALADALGINGTPGFVIGNQIVPGAISLDEIRQLIAEARQS